MCLKGISHLSSLIWRCSCPPDYSLTKQKNLAKYVWVFWTPNTLDDYTRENRLYSNPSYQYSNALFFSFHSYLRGVSVQIGLCVGYNGVGWNLTKEHGQMNGNNGEETSVYRQPARPRREKRHQTGTRSFTLDRENREAYPHCLRSAKVTKVNVQVKKKKQKYEEKKYTPGGRRDTSFVIPPLFPSFFL